MQLKNRLNSFDKQDNRGTGTRGVWTSSLACELGQPSRGSSSNVAPGDDHGFGICLPSNSERKSCADVIIRIRRSERKAEGKWHTSGKNGEVSGCLWPNHALTFNGRPCCVDPSHEDDDDDLVHIWLSAGECAIDSYHSQVIMRVNH